MNLLQPLALAGLALLPIIVILHMLRSRRRRVVVSSTMLWRDLPPPVLGSRRRRLPLTLLLLLHLLIATLLVAALTRPVLTRWLSGRPMHHIVVLDTTTSMAAREGAGTRFDLARGQVEGLINGLAGRDRLTLVQMGSQPRVVAQGGTEDKAGLSQALAGLRPGATGTDLAQALYLASGVVDAEHDNRILVLSDRALAQASRRDLPATLSAPVVWPTLGGAAANQALLSVSSRRRPDGQTSVFARIANYAATPATRRVQLLADGDRLADQPVSLKAEGEVEQVWTVPAGVKVVEVRLTGDDALALDDRAFLSLEDARRRPTVVVGRNTDALERALRANPTLRVTTATPESYTPALDTELTVFEGFLPATLPSGGVIIVNPPLDGQFRLAGPRLSLALDQADDPLVSGIDFAAVRFDNVPRVGLPAWAQPVVTVRDHPLVVRGQTGQSRVVGLTFDLKSTNLTAKLAFPLLLARAVSEVTRPALPPTVLAGASVPLTTSPGSEARVTRQTDTGERPVPLGAGNTLESTETPGLYSVSEQRGPTVTLLGRLAVHAGAAVESDVRPQPAPRFETATAQPGTAGGEPTGRDVWMFLAAAALAVLTLEVFVARR